MRRPILVAVSAIALAGAMAVGPFGAAAAAPYVYGCTPAAFFNTTSPYRVSLNIYNGTASRANLTHKLLSAGGTILNAPQDPYYGVLVTSSLLPTHTFYEDWLTEGDDPTGSPATVRIVSNVPVSATLTHETPVGHWVAIFCAPIQP